MRTSLTSLAALLERGEVRPLVVASHPRSGTHLTIDLLRRQFAPCQGWKYWGEGLSRMYVDIDRLQGVSASQVERAVRVLRRAARPLIKTHALPTFERTYGISPCEAFEPRFVAALKSSATFCYVYRDGRDVMVSCRNFLKRPGAPPPPPIGEFIRQREGGMSRVRAWAHHVTRWMEEPDVCCVRMEELLDETRRSLDLLRENVREAPLGVEPLLPSPPAHLLGLRMSRLFHTRPETTGILTPMSTGGEGGAWRHQFTRADREFFAAEAGDLLYRLGYEETNDWITSDAVPGGWAAHKPRRSPSARHLYG